MHSVIFKPLCKHRYFCRRFLVGVIAGRLTGSSGSSCESSISAAERPDMSARTAYSLYLESVSGPCFTHNHRCKKHIRHRISGSLVMPYIVF